MTSNKDKDPWKLPQIPPLPPSGAPIPLLPDVMRLLRLPTYSTWQLPLQLPPSTPESATTRQEQFRPSTVPPPTPQLPPQLPPPPPLLDDGIRGAASAAAAAGESANSALFRCGTLLSCGAGGSAVKRVEDLTAADFVLSGSLPQRYRLEWCRVLSMQDAAGDCVVIQMTPGDSDRARIIRLPTAQPLFVPGKGWTSRRPEVSRQRHGLRCCQLALGDCVVSLVPREAATASTTAGGASSDRADSGRPRKKPRCDVQQLELDAGVVDRP